MPPRLLHHEFLHRHIGTRWFTAVMREEILPRLRIQINAVETEPRNFCDTAANGLPIAVERLEKISKPNAEEWALAFFGIHRRSNTLKSHSSRQRIIGISL